MHRVWRLFVGAGLVAAGSVALIEDHLRRPEYDCIRAVGACERGEGLHALPGRLTETSYNVLGAVGWVMALSGGVLIVVTLFSLARALKQPG